MSELILDSYEYIPAEYVIMHCMIRRCLTDCRSLRGYSVFLNYSNGHAKHTYGQLKSSTIIFHKTLILYFKK